MASVLVSIIVVLTGSLRGEGMRRHLGAQQYEDIFMLPTGPWLNALSLGHRESLADLIWLRALVYIGDEIANRGDLSHIDEYADAMLALDPNFARVYLWASTLGLYRPSASLDDGLRSVAYLERAHERFPDRAILVWDLAAAYAYELPSLTDDPNEKRRLRSIGADYMQRAAMLGVGPAGLALSSATHLESIGRSEQAVRHLEEMYAVVNDEDVREEIARRLDGLRAESNAAALRLADRELRRRAEADYPWVPVDFQALLGDRRVPARR